jgi:hypothetical protein
MTDFDFITPRTTEEATLTFDFGAGVQRILAGLSNNFVGIWADPTAGSASGMVYFLSTGTGAALSIVDMETKLLYDRYTKDLKGRANESLDQEDPVDIVS